PGKFPAPRISIERIENAEKNRWHAEAYRYALLLHQIKESLGVSEWPRQNDLCAGQGSSKRNPPSIGVKQRGHLQYRVPRRNGEGIDAAAIERMKHQGAVRVHYTLGAPGRAGGIAHRRRFVFVQLRILEILACGAEEIFIAFAALRGLAAPERHDNHALEFHALAEF